MAREIFVSYRRGDSPGFAGRLFDRIEDAFGEGAVFMDVDGIDPGLDFVDVLNEQLTSCKALVAIIGPDWARAMDAHGRRRLDDPNDFVRLEIATALSRGVRVIPVLVEGATPPGTDDLPEDLSALARRQGVVISHERFGRDIEPLIAALRRAVGEPPSGAGSVAVSQASHQRQVTGRERVAAVLKEMRGLDNMYYAPSIPPHKIANARKKAHIPADLEVLAVMDFTVFGNANDSMSFTEAGLHYHHSLNTAGHESQFLPLDAIRVGEISKDGPQKVRVGAAILHIDGGAKPDQVVSLLQAIQRRC